jgi:hypothetical protein
MATLSGNDVGKLRKRGIEIERDIYGVKYVFSLQGLYWLFNHLYEKGNKGKKQRLTGGMLKAIASAPAGKNWRALRVKAVELPIYSGAVFQLAIYLNGTPPKLLHNTDSLKGLVERISFLGRSTDLTVLGDTEAVWELTEGEQKLLGAGEYLEFTIEQVPDL